MQRFLQSINLYSHAASSIIILLAARGKAPPARPTECNVRYPVAIMAIPWQLLLRKGSEDLSGICCRVGARRRFAENLKRLGNRGRYLQKRYVVFRNSRKKMLPANKNPDLVTKPFSRLDWAQKLSGPDGKVFSLSALYR